MSEAAAYTALVVVVRGALPPVRCGNEGSMRMHLGKETMVLWPPCSCCMGSRAPLKRMPPGVMRACPHGTAWAPTEASHRLRCLLHAVQSVRMAGECATYMHAQAERHGRAALPGGGLIGGLAGRGAGRGAAAAPRPARAGDQRRRSAAGGRAGAAALPAQVGGTPPDQAPVPRHDRSTLQRSGSMQGCRKGTPPIVEAALLAISCFALRMVVAVLVWPGLRACPQAMSINSCTGMQAGPADV